MGKTSIAWCDHSVNPIRARDPRTNTVGHHCEKVSAGCQNCYASALQKRFGLSEFAGPSRREGLTHFLDESKLREVLGRKKRTRYFWCDMSDIFGEWVRGEWIAACFRVMGKTPQHTHQVLTKRADRMQRWMREQTNAHAIRMLDEPGFCVEWPYPNVWLGVSVEDQAAADARHPLLMATPAAVHFWSAEPLLGAIDAGPLWAKHGAPSWVILGGESGHSARPCHIEWVYSLIDQCRTSQVPCFVKQLGSAPVMESGPNRPGLIPVLQRDRKGGDPAEWSPDLRVREFPR